MISSKSTNAVRRYEESDAEEAAGAAESEDDDEDSEAEPEEEEEAAAECMTSSYLSARILNPPYLSYLVALGR